MMPTYTVISLKLDHDLNGDPRLNVGHMFDEGVEGTLVTSDNLISLYDQGLDKLGCVDVYVCSSKMAAENLYRMKGAEQSGVKRLAFGGTAEGSGVMVTWNPDAKFEFRAHDLRDPSLIVSHGVETYGCWMLDLDQCRNIEATVGHIVSNGAKLRRSTLNAFVDAMADSLPSSAQKTFIEDAQLELEEHIHGWVAPIGISVDDILKSSEKNDELEEIIEHVTDGEIKAAIRSACRSAMKHSDNASTSDIIWDVRTKLSEMIDLKASDNAPR